MILLLNVFFLSYQAGIAHRVAVLYSRPQESVFCRLASISRCFYSVIIRNGFIIIYHWRPWLFQPLQSYKIHLLNTDEMSFSLAMHEK